MGRCVAVVNLVVRPVADPTFAVVLIVGYQQPTLGTAESGADTTPTSDPLLSSVGPADSDDGHPLPPSGDCRRVRRRGVILVEVEDTSVEPCSSPAAFVDNPTPPLAAVPSPAAFADVDTVPSPATFANNPIPPLAAVPPPAAFADEAEGMDRVPLPSIQLADIYTVASSFRSADLDAVAEHLSSAFSIPWRPTEFRRLIAAVAFGRQQAALQLRQQVILSVGVYPDPTQILQALWQQLETMTQL